MSRSRQPCASVGGQIRICNLCFSIIPAIATLGGQTAHWPVVMTYLLPRLHQVSMITSLGRKYSPAVKVNDYHPNEVHCQNQQLGNTWSRPTSYSASEQITWRNESKRKELADKVFSTFILGRCQRWNSSHFIRQLSLLICASHGPKWWCPVSPQ